jgi:hypothetical protein
MLQLPGDVMMRRCGMVGSWVDDRVLLPLRLGCSLKACLPLRTLGTVRVRRCMNIIGMVLRPPSGHTAAQCVKGHCAW